MCDLSAVLHLDEQINCCRGILQNSAYRISSVVGRSFFLPKQSQRSRSFGLFRKGKIGIIAKFHRTDLVI